MFDNAAQSATGFINSAMQQAQQASAMAARNPFAGSAPGAPSQAITVLDIINRAGPLLERLRDVAAGVEAFGDRLVGAQPPQPGTVAGSSSAMPGSLGELSHLLNLSHATLGRIEDGLRRLHELHG